MANIARRLMLGIPICLSDEDHRYTQDGYCQCGAEKPRDPRKIKLEGRELHAPRPRVNLDIIEGNREYL